jgi:hypothetical protein
VPAPTRGQDQYRDGDPGFPPLAQQRQPVHPRQAQIKDDGIVAFGLDEEIRALAVCRGINRITRTVEGAGELPGQRRFIFRHQDPHVPGYTAGEPEPELNAF